MLSTNGDFIDIHEKLLSFPVVEEFFLVVEKKIGLLEYCNGRNASARWIFQIFTQEFIDSLASLLENEDGPILEVMAGDGKLTEFLQSRVNAKIVATDSKRDSQDIAYPKWVVDLDALEAVKEVDPSVVIMCWEPLYSDIGLTMVDRGIPLIWIGDPEKCAPNSGIMQREKLRINSQFALGRYDSFLTDSFNTDIFLFNMDLPR